MSGRHDEGAFRIREEAERRLNISPAELGEMSAADVERLVHELQVHQIELEMQNDELRRLHLELEAAGHEYHELYDFAPVGYLTVDGDGVVRKANLRACALLDVDRQKLVGGKLTRFVEADDVGLLLRHFRDLSSAGERKVCVVRRPLQEGGPRYLRVESVPVEQGAVRSVRTVLQDVTGQVTAEAHRAMLMAELNHRVKNVLNVVLSIAKQTMTRSGSMEEFRKAFESRLVALAEVHGLLTKHEWHGCKVGELVEGATAPYAGPDTVRYLTRPEVTVGAGVAQCLYLALHELATNAAKYGALSTPSGTVSVGWKVIAVEGPPHLSFTWREAGGPAVSPPSRKGFGTTLLEQALAYELGGEADLRFEPGGVVFEMRVPLAEGALKTADA